tara:strand:+ start:740 stop:1357 length:618 start_codon:yes stop_codon:yes gene_type:complete
MRKETCEDIINSLRSRRDALGYAHEKLKQDSDSYNKIIIIVSLGAGMLESIKMRLDLTSAGFALAPILLSSGIAGISALMKFRNYPTRMESITQASSVLNNCLQKARNHQFDADINEDLMSDYNASLLACETAIYPSERKQFMIQSHRNLLMILKTEKKYFDEIEIANSGISISSDSTENIMDISTHKAKPILNTINEQEAEHNL